MTGIGAGQAQNWTYGYLQGRFIHKDLFAQAFWNRSNAGDTYVVRSGDPTIDNSDLYVGQIQHGYSFGEWQRFTYGMDVLLTRPDTEGTINGVNEEDDSINEIGAYLQSETKILPQLKFIAAGRVDDHNQLEDIVLSPRVALVYQPNNDHNLRVTYNRAFNTPRTSDLFLDILSVGDAFGLGANFQPVLGFSPNIDIRAWASAPKRDSPSKEVRTAVQNSVLPSRRWQNFHQRHIFHLTILSSPTLCGVSDAVPS